MELVLVADKVLLEDWIEEELVDVLLFTDEDVLVVVVLLEDWVEEEPVPEPEVLLVTEEEVVVVVLLEDPVEELDVLLE
ncbi:MAG: hypothetical protein KGI25_05390 [Thaumarchaeota archaeon]|nr:hypothetical protein [Nitrososphaerota archaeon]